MSVRAKYVERFGEEQAAKLEAAASEHGTSHMRGKGKGSDPFKWALLIAIGYECPTRDSFREYHGITVAVEDFKAFCRDEAELDTHDGDFDYLSLFAGAYNEYMPPKADSAEVA